jgi:hypothetical protein
MALTIDSHQVLRLLADHPEAFPAIQADLGDLVGKLLIKQIKKTPDLALFVEIYGITGAATMSTILDGFSTNDLSALLKKIDPYFSLAQPSSDLKAVRAHITNLATARATPAAKPEKAPKNAKAPKAVKAAPPKIGGLLESKVHSGRKAPVKKKI